MKAMITGLAMAGLLAGAATAAECPTDFDYVSPLGHDGRKASMAALGSFFKAAKANDKDAFMAVAADPYIQHSPDLADGIEPVWDLVAKRPDGFSSTQIQWLGPQGFLDNGNYLVMLREVDRGDGTPKSKVFDLLYFDDEGKYAEHWDMRQALSDETASGRSETGEAEIYANAPVSYDVATEEAGKLPPLCYDIRFILAQNDLVWVYSKVATPDGIAAIVDLIRVRDGKMAEHWDIIQPMPAESANDNGMF